MHSRSDGACRVRPGTAELRWARPYSHYGMKTIRRYLPDLFADHRRVLLGLCPIVEISEWDGSHGSARRTKYISEGMTWAERSVLFNPIAPKRDGYNCLVLSTFSIPAVCATALADSSIAEPAGILRRSIWSVPQPRSTRSWRRSTRWAALTTSCRRTIRALGQSDPLLARVRGGVRPAA